MGDHDAVARDQSLGHLAGASTPLFAEVTGRFLRVGVTNGILGGVSLHSTKKERDESKGK